MDCSYEALPWFDLCGRYFRLSDIKRYLSEDMMNALNERMQGNPAFAFGEGIEMALVPLNIVVSHLTLICEETDFVVQTDKDRNLINRLSSLEPEAYVLLGA